jgi:septum formation protein
MVIPIFLVSSSPQRRRLLRSCGVRFRVVRIRYRERLRHGLSPAQNAMRLALAKARAARGLKGLVIGADTLVVLGNKIIGKPSDERHARRMLRSFSGKPQWIYTGVCLRNTVSGNTVVFVDRSKVRFKKMSEREIEVYLKTGEYRGKAGAFGLQGRGAHLIRSVSGSRSNVIGLPLEKLMKFLPKLLRTSS